MGEYREAPIISSSPSSPLRTPSSQSHNLNYLRRQSYFHGDNNRFSPNSWSDYSLSSSFSSPEDSPSPFASITPKHNHTAPYRYGDHDLGLCEDFYRFNINEDEEEEDYDYNNNSNKLRYGVPAIGSIHDSNRSGGFSDPLCNLASFSPNFYESSNNIGGGGGGGGGGRGGGFVDNGGLFDPSCGSLLFNNKDESIANYRQIGWPSYSNSNGYGVLRPGLNQGVGVGGGGGIREYSQQQNDVVSPLFSQGAIGPASSKLTQHFNSDDSFFVENKTGPTRGGPLMTMMMPPLDHHQQYNERLPNICDIQGYVYLMAKDQHGCRFLQRIFDEGTPMDAMVIFDEVIAHVVELMMDPFGNYLMQKLLDVCTEEQRTQIVIVATSEPGQLIRISLNAYGTRVVQRLVETINTGKQISLVKSALRPGFLDLIKDLNGNHVIQRCLQCLSTEDNKFIFDAATKFCTEIATHRHGCCVLQKCIAYSMRQQREKLIAEISRNSLLLAQDPFGNYAVQFVIELRIPCAVAMMLSQLKGHYVQLSMQKFSSHMVERCIMHCPESRPQIVRELVSVPHFDQLLQDPYANFVIQAALAATKGPLHASLVEVIRPHSILRNNPYCKRIFSRNLLKK
ncbi:unnamed protein product [Cochlearia groenlandica]